MTKTRNSEIRIEDVLKYSNAVNRNKVHSDVIDDVIEVSDYEMCFGAFLTNVENRLKKNFDYSTLKGKSKKEILNTLQGRLDVVLEEFLEKYRIDMDRIIKTKQIASS